jgi:hypothetical protein
MKQGQQVTGVGVSPLSQDNLTEEARLSGAGFFAFLTASFARRVFSDASVSIPALTFRTPGRTAEGPATSR